MKNPDKKFFEDMEARQREFAIKLAASTAATNAAENKKGLGDLFEGFKEVLNKAFTKNNEERVTAAQTVITEVNKHTSKEIKSLKEDSWLLSVTSWLVAVFVAAVVGIGAYALFSYFGYNGIGPFTNPISMKAVTDAAGNILTYVPDKYEPIKAGVWLCTGLSSLSSLLISLAIAAGFRNTRKGV